VALRKKVQNLLLTRRPTNFNPLELFCISGYHQYTLPDFTYDG
jgi:hypothetical protein